MPNIEIHGYVNREAAGVLAEDIFKLFADHPCVNEMVVTICDTVVLDKDRHSQPFLRLVCSDPKEAEEIIPRLCSLDLDVEHMQLQAFYLKKEKNMEKLFASLGEDEEDEKSPRAL